jgi:hypothetical protein
MGFMREMVGWGQGKMGEGSGESSRIGNCRVGLCDRTSRGHVEGKVKGRSLV